MERKLPSTSPPPFFPASYLTPFCHISRMSLSLVFPSIPNIIPLYSLYSLGKPKPPDWRHRLSCRRQRLPPPPPPLSSNVALPLSTRSQLSSRSDKWAPLKTSLGPLFLSPIPFTAGSTALSTPPWFVFLCRIASFLCLASAMLWPPFSLCLRTTSLSIHVHILHLSFSMPQPTVLYLSFVAVS